MQFDFNVQANQSQHIDVAGTFVKYKSGTGQIRIRLNGGGYIDLLPGQGVNNVAFNNIDVQDRTGAANVGTILAGVYDFRDDRITGTVEVINGERTRTDQNRAFVAYANGAANAGCYPHQQLWNPPGSGKNLIVEKISLVSATAQALRVASIQTALTVTSGYVQSKKLGGVVGSIQARQQSDLNAMQGNLIYNTVCEAGKAMVITFSEPILVPPGWGLMTVGTAQNSDLPTNFEYYEDPL